MFGIVIFLVVSLVIQQSEQIGCPPETIIGDNKCVSSIPTRASNYADSLYVCQSIGGNLYTPASEQELTSVNTELIHNLRNCVHDGYWVNGNVIADIPITITITEDKTMEYKLFPSELRHRIGKNEMSCTSQNEGTRFIFIPEYFVLGERSFIEVPDNFMPARTMHVLCETPPTE